MAMQHLIEFIGVLHHLLLMNKKMRIFRLLASHPIFLFKLNKSGFDECYQSAIKWEFEKSKSQYFQGFAGPHIHFLLIPTRWSQGV